MDSRAAARIHVREPWFGEIASRRKTVEARVGPLARYQHLRGASVVIHGGARQVLARVADVRHYSSLEEYLAGEGWERAAPHTGGPAAAEEAHLGVYRGEDQVFSPDRVRRAGGICALVLRYP